MSTPRHSGFTLVQLSVMLMVASLVMVTILPSSQTTLDNNRVTTERMNDLYKSFRSYMVANSGKLPCPADATLAQGAANYGLAAANSGSSTDCSGGTPAANYVDASHNVAIGMVPVKSLGLPNEYAYDAWGRTITYAVDTAITGTCWSSPATGAITVTDNGTAYTAVMALISHGANGHGAFIPLAGATGTAVRFNNNSGDTNELLNAHVDSSFAATSTLTNFVVTPPSSTFDDILVYKNTLWSMNVMPAGATASGATVTSVTTPAPNAYYVNDSVEGCAVSNCGPMVFTVNFSTSVTLNSSGGTPRLTLTPITVGGGTVSLTANSGTGAVGYANYSGSSPSTGTSFNFTYMPVVSDMAPNGLTLGSSVDLNGGSISPLCGTNPTFTPPSIAGVIIPKVSAITSSGTWVVPNDWNNSFNFIEAFGSGGNGASGSGAAGGGGGGSGYLVSNKMCSLSTGTSYAVTVGTAGGTTATQLGVSGNAPYLKADYGKNASGATAGGAGAGAGSGYSATCPYNKKAGAAGGAGGATLYGGGGGGGGAAGPSGAGTAGGAGRAPSSNGGGGGGGGGGADNSGSATAGTAGTAGAGPTAGGKGGKCGYAMTNNNGGTAPAGAGGSGVPAQGGGGGGGGSNAASTTSGAGGAGSMCLGVVGVELGFLTNANVYYGSGSGGGGSGGANGATSNSGIGGNAGGYGGGGGGSGGATGTAGTAGSGAPGLIIIEYR